MTFVEPSPPSSPPPLTSLFYRHFLCPPLPELRGPGNLSKNLSETFHVDRLPFTASAWHLQIVMILNSTLSFMLPAFRHIHRNMLTSKNWNGTGIYWRFLCWSHPKSFSPKKLSERLSILIQRLVEEKRLQGGFPVDSSSSEELLLEIYKVTVYCLIIRYYLSCLHTTDHFYDSSLFTESNHTTPGISSPTLDGQHKPFRKIGRHLSFHSTLSPKYITGSDA